MTDDSDPRVQAMVRLMTGSEINGVLLDRSPAWWTNFMRIALGAADSVDPMRKTAIDNESASTSSNYIEKPLYFLKGDWEAEWRSVSKDVWIQAERAAGFRPKCSFNDPAYDTTCATGGFSGGAVQGRIEY